MTSPAKRRKDRNARKRTKEAKEAKKKTIEDKRRNCWDTVILSKDYELDGLKDVTPYKWQHQLVIGE